MLHVPMRMLFLLFTFLQMPTFLVVAQDKAYNADANPDGKLAQSFVIGYERFSRHGDLDSVESGSLLISELGCAACHETKEMSFQAASAPDLSDAGHRLGGEWVADYLLDPHGEIAGTRMPAALWALDDSTRKEKADAIALFLGTQQIPLSLPRANGAAPVLHEFWNKGQADHGQELYHSIGCVACHAVDPDYEAMDTPASSMDRLLEQLDPEEIEELGLTRQLRPVPSIPAFLPGKRSHLGAKYSKQSLTLFLLDPHRVRPSGRMPSLRLTPSEAADLSAYLIGDSRKRSSFKPLTKQELPSVAERISEGRVAFKQFGCVNCHQIGGDMVRSASLPMSELDFDSGSNCLSSPKESMPQYHLDDQQIENVRLAIQTHQMDSGKIVDDSEVDRAHLVKMQMIRLNCVACHQRAFEEGGPVLGGIGKDRKVFFETTAKVDIGDEGRFPPALTGVGAKLTDTALKGVFDAKALTHRPFMTIRMPTYHQSEVEELLRDLPVADLRINSNESQLFPEDEKVGRDKMLAAGRELINTGCVECHVFREEQLPGAVGVDLNAIDKRLQPSWFRQFVENPERLKHRTRMPTFFPEGKSNRQDLLDGDVDRQIAAIWHYLKRTDPLPGKILQAMAQDFELIPRDRPEIIRTFMSEVGTHAIAVGFPQGVHFAFDSDAVRLTSVWRGRFLDARGTWFERFVPLTKPLGNDQLSIPRSVGVLVGRQDGFNNLPDSVIFKGYQLDSRGVPALLYQVADWEISDQIEPFQEGDGKENADWSLLRRWTVNRVKDTIRPGMAESSTNGSSSASNDDQTKRGVPRGDTVIDGRFASHPSRLVLNLHSGKTLTKIDPYTYQSESGLKVSVRNRKETDLTRASKVSSHEDLGEQVWHLELNADSKQTLEVIYQW